MSREAGLRWIVRGSRRKEAGAYGQPKFPDLWVFGIGGSGKVRTTKRRAKRGR